MLLAHDAALASSLNDPQLSPVDIAAATGEAEILKLLLIHGAAIKSGGWNPVYIATFSNQPETLAVLIRGGAKIDPLDGRGLVPLNWAAITGTTDTAGLVLKHKAEANQAVALVKMGRSLMVTTRPLSSIK